MKSKEITVDYTSLIEVVILEHVKYKSLSPVTHFTNCMTLKNHLQVNTKVVQSVAFTSLHYIPQIACQ